MARIGKRLQWIAFVLLLSWNCFAEVTVQSEMDVDLVGIGDPVRISVLVTTTNGEETTDPQPPKLADFEYQGVTQNVSSSTNIVIGGSGANYVKTTSKEYFFTYTATREGTFTVPGIEVKAESKTYVTKPLQIKVVKEASSLQGQNRNRKNNRDLFDEQEEVFNQLLKRHGLGGRAFPGPQQPQEEEESLAEDSKITNPPTNPKETFSIRLEVDKKEVFEGEQIVANWYIYSRANILTLDRQKFPDLRGFWKEIIEEVPALNFSQIVVNGIPYSRALLASHALFPIKPGTAVIDEYRVKAQVQLVDSTFGVFGFGKPYSFVRASERVPIKVKPLPVEGRPRNFAGAVGDFEVKSFIDGSNFSVNQPFSLRVRFEGAGNAKLIELPSLNLPPSLEVYSTKSDSKYFKNGRSFKEFEVLVIPRQAGEMKIPALEFAIFDPKQEKYLLKSTQPLEIKINPSADGTNPVAAPAPQSNKVDPEIFSPVLILQPDLEDPFRTWNQPLFWLSLYGALILGAVLYYRKVQGSSSKRVKLRTKLDLRIKKLLPAAEKNQHQKIGAEIVNLVYFILGEVSGQKSAGLELRKLLELCPPSLRREQAGPLEKLMEQAQILGFAPEELAKPLAGAEKLKNILKQTQDVLSKCCEYE